MQPSLYISHGSPMLALDPGASGVAMRRLADALPRPDAIVLMSAHWASHELRVSSAAHPETWHDFSGFPPALHQVQYPAPGNPELAGRILQMLDASDLPAQADEQRPFDHGTWVPLSLMYPQADIPVVQISLPVKLGPAFQQRIGKALRPLRQQNILLIGSGSITHNLYELDRYAEPEVSAPWAQAFRDWMVAALVAGDEEALLNYRQLAPHATRNHPTDEHLLPLYFARGAGDAFKIEHSGFTLGSLAMDIYSFA